MGSICRHILGCMYTKALFLGCPWVANSLGAQTFTRVSPSTISVFTLCSNIEGDSHVKQGHRNKKQVHNNKKATDTKDASYKGHKQHKSQTPYPIHPSKNEDASKDANQNPLAHKKQANVQSDQLRPQHHRPMAKQDNQRPHVTTMTNPSDVAANGPNGCWAPAQG